MSKVTPEPVVLTKMISGGREPLNLLESIRGRYFEDHVFKKVLEQPRNYKNFETTQDGLIYMKLNGTQTLCIPNIRVAGRSI